MVSKPEIKRLGTYLIEAGLITPSQVDVALNDQEFMEDKMRFGEVLVARGWVKQQTLDFLMEKVVEPEQLIARRVVLEEAMVVRHSAHHEESHPLYHPDYVQPEYAPDMAFVDPNLVETLIEPELETPTVPQVTSSQVASSQVLGQARSLDGDTVFQVVMPSRHTAAAIDPKADPSIINQRKPLSSLPEEEDGLNWVG